MSTNHTATIAWIRSGEPFTDNKYSRAHTWAFDGGIVVPASSSPHVVRPPFSKADAVDPEEAFIAALSSCHMLTFLWIAAGRGFVVDRYDDAAVGTLAKDAAGSLAMTSVVLRPRVAFAGARRPSVEEHEAMHHEAHEQCFIARSVKTAVRCEPVDTSAA
jgi:organic hydroperoxide reductase OsmC/OhrA